MEVGSCARFEAYLVHGGGARRMRAQQDACKRGIRVALCCPGLVTLAECAPVASRGTGRGAVRGGGAGGAGGGGAGEGGRASLKRWRRSRAQRTMTIRRGACTLGGSRGRGYEEGRGCRVRVRKVRAAVSAGGGAAKNCGLPPKRPAAGSG